VKQRAMLEHVIGDKALIDAAQGVGKSLRHSFQSRHDLGERIQRAAAVEFPRVMGHGLDAKHTFAFAIDLHGQLAAVQLEDRQIIGRSLDGDFALGRSLGSAISRAATVSQDPS